MSNSYNLGNIIIGNNSALNERQYQNDYKPKKFSQYSQNTLQNLKYSEVLNDGYHLPRGKKQHIDLTLNKVESPKGKRQRQNSGNSNNVEEYSLSARHHKGKKILNKSVGQSHDIIVSNKNYNLISSFLYDVLHLNYTLQHY